MEIRNLKKILSDHKKWINCKDGTCANLHNADLRGADLHNADLLGANLRSADFDFSCFPLWCGGSNFKVNSKLIWQLFAHICTLEVVDADEKLKALLEAILPEAKKSHRAKDLELIE